MIFNFGVLRVSGGVHILLRDWLEPLISLANLHLTRPLPFSQSNNHALNRWVRIGSDMIQDAL